MADRDPDEHASTVSGDAMASTIGSDQAVATQATVGEPGTIIRPAELAPGSQLERFVVEEKLGAGAMGIVYAAHDPELDRRIAIKLIKNRGEGLRARLYREAQALARVAHPNVVVVHEVGTHDDQVFVAMELVRGDTLRSWLAQKRPLREVLRVLVDAGRGLAAAHAADLVHRDFKPDNVLLGGDGRARVTDFGLARTSGDDPGEPPGEARIGSPVTSPLHATLTQTGMMVGTPVYASPEQLAGERVGPASDQFSFCITAYEALYGKRPFDAPNLADLMAKVMEGKVGPPPKQARVPKRIERALLRGLAPRPEDRFASMDALLAELVLPRARWPLAAGAGVAVAGVAIGVAVGVARPSASTTPTCGSAADAIAAIWNPEVSARIHASLVARDPKNAGAVHAQLDKQYTRYAQAWSAARIEACREGGDPGRARCLEQGLDRLRSNLTDIAKPDTSTSIVLRFAQLLEPIAYCKQQTKAPDAKSFAGVQQARMKITLARGDWLKGERDQSKRALLGLLATPEAAAYLPLQAEIYTALGTTAMLEGDAESAVRHLRTSLGIAESAGEDRHKAIAGLELGAALIARKQLDEAAYVLDQAGATIERFGGDVELQAQLALKRAKLLDARGKTADALPLVQEAIDLYARIGEDMPIDALGDKITLYTKLGRTEEATVLLRKLLGGTAPTAQSGPDLHALTEECDNALKQGRLDDGKRACAAAVANAPTQGMGRMLAPHIGLAVVHELAEEYEPARASYIRALQLYVEMGHTKQAAETLESIGRASYELGDHPAAIENYRRCIQVATALGADGADQIVFARNGLGRSFAASGKLAEGIVELEWALPRFEVMPSPQRGVLGGARLALADALWRRNKGSDRARAKLLVESARIDAAAHRAKFEGDADPLNPLYRRKAEGLQKRIAAWVAKH